MEGLEKNIASLGVKRAYPKGALLFVAGDEARGFYSILSGEVRVFKMDEKGREMEVVRLRPGDFFGEAVAVVSGRFPAFAQAARNSEVLFFERQTFFRSLENSPELARFFLKLLARKCLILNERIETLSLRTVRQRLIQYFLSHCSGDKACLVDLKIKKSELAKLLGTISETLSRNLREMEDEGLIEVKGRAIRVKDCSRMREALSC